MKQPASAAMASGGRRSGYWRKLGNDLLRDRWLYLLMLPGVVWYLIYRYLPMLGLYIAFN